EASAKLPDLSGRAVLVVDDVARTGATLAKARALAKKSGAKDVRTAALVTRPGGARPDFAALETDELVLFGWDYQLDGAGGGPVDPGEVGV
ncbi:MAG TPA: phosphoribosyltransferase family protein, partial [Anaeromyxobacter sp.]